MSKKSFVAILLFTFVGITAFAQAEYTHESAEAELKQIQESISKGLPTAYNRKLFTYIYEHHNTFPAISADATYEERLEKLLTIYSQIVIIMRNKLKFGMDYISKTDAMIYASSGYQAAKILPMLSDFMNNLDKSDPSYTIRINGYHQALKGIEDYLTGYAVSTFIENEREEADMILTSSLFEFAPTIISALPVQTRESLADAIQQNIKKKDVRLKKEYKSFLKTIKS